MTYTYNDVQALETQTCANCGVLFAAPEHFLDKRREDGKNFYCPSGHSLVFRVTEADRLRKQLAREERARKAANAWAVHERDQRAAAERSLRATRGHLTRTKRRVGNGVCPCCNRHFDNVARHMATKHPDYADEQAGAQQPQRRDVLAGLSELQRAAYDVLAEHGEARATSRTTAVRAGLPQVNVKSVTSLRRLGLAERIGGGRYRLVGEADPE